MSLFSRTLTQSIVMHRIPFCYNLALLRLRTRLFFSFFMLATVAPLSTFAQKEVKEIRAAIKAKKPADACVLLQSKERIA